MAKKKTTAVEVIQDEFFTDYVTLKPNGLGAVIRTDISYEHWEQAVYGYATALASYEGKKERARFALGDLFIYGEEHFGEKFAQAFDRGTIDKHTADNIISVCRKIPQAERHPALTFSHHEVVAGIDEAEIREELLTTAETESLPVSKLRKLRNEKYPSKKRTPKKKTAPVTDPVVAEKLTDAEAIARVDSVIEYLLGAEKELPFKQWVAADINRWADKFATFRRMERRAGFGHGKGK